MFEHRTIEPSLPPTHTITLFRINQALAAATDNSAFLDTALGELCVQIRPLWARVLVNNIDGSEATIVAAWPERAVPIQPFKINAAAEQSLKIEHLTTAPIQDVAALVELFPASTAASLHLLPLVRLDSRFGTLLIGIDENHTTSPDDQTLIELVGDKLAGALYGRRMAEALNRRDDHLRIVADIAAHVSSSLEPREVYRQVVQKLNEYFHVDAGSLLLRDEATDELVFVMTLEAGEEKLYGLRLPPGVGIAGHVAQTQKIHISNNVQRDPLHYVLQSSDDVDVDVQAILCAPMVVKDVTIGVIELINKQGGPFNEKDAERLMLVANIIGVAIENARLFEFVRQRRERLERLLDQMMGEGVSQEKLLGMLARELAVQDTRLLAKFNNPYIVGTPVLKPEMCFGREPLFKRILSVLHQNSLLLHGERRIGKTTVLRQLKLRLQAQDEPDYRFRPVYIDLQGVEEDAFFHFIMEETLRIFGKRTSEIALRYNPRRPNYSGRDFQHDLREVITQLCGPQPGGRIDRLVLLMDEADVMYGFDERVLQEFRRVFMNDYATYLSVVFAAVDVQRQWRRYESPFYNLFQHIPITSLTRPDTELLARTPVRGRYDYQEAAIDMIYQLSQGRPMQVQLLCLEAINHIREQGRSVVTPDDIERVSAVIKQEGRL